MAITQNNYKIKIINVLNGVNKLNAWPKNPLDNFTLKYCLLDGTNIIENGKKDKWVYRSYKIAFDGKGSWSFGNDFAKNVAIFGVSNSSSSHSNNCNNNFLILGEGPTSDINGSSTSPEKNIVLILVKETQNNFASVYITNMIIVICLLIENKSKSLKLIKKCWLSN